MPRAPTWDVVDRGDVPSRATTIPFTCPNCGRTAALPVLGVPVAQLGEGLLFDPGERAIPRQIRCRRCRYHYELAEQT